MAPILLYISTEINARPSRSLSSCNQRTWSTPISFASAKFTSYFVCDIFVSFLSWVLYDLCILIVGVYTLVLPVLKTARSDGYLSSLLHTLLTNKVTSITTRYQYATTYEGWIEMIITTLRVSPYCIYAHILYMFMIFAQVWHIL